MIKWVELRTQRGYDAPHFGVYTDPQNNFKLGDLVGTVRWVGALTLVEGQARVTKDFYLLRQGSLIVAIPKKDVAEMFMPSWLKKEFIKIDLGKTYIPLTDKKSADFWPSEFDYKSSEQASFDAVCKGTVTGRSRPPRDYTSPRLVFTPVKAASELVIGMFDRETEERIVRLLKPEKAWELDVVWQKTNGDCYTEIAPLVEERIHKHRIGEYKRFNPALLERGAYVTPDGVIREITRYDGVEVGWVTTRRSNFSARLLATYNVVDDQFRKEIKERHRRISKALHNARLEERNGLYEKFEVKNKETGEVVKNTFTLRPGLDPHANVALRAYAESVKTENPALYGDLMNWLG